MRGLRQITLAVALQLAMVCQCATLYSTWLNGFAYFALPAHSTMRQRQLFIDNTTSATLLATDTVTHDRNASFRFVASIANRHNSEGRRYAYIDARTGKKRKTENPQWGVLWNYVDSLNYCALTLQCANSCLHDLLDVRSMTATVTRTAGGRTTTLRQVTLTRGVNLYEGFNNVRVVADSLGTTVLLGSDGLVVAARLPELTPVAGSPFGTFAGKGALLAVKRMVIQSVHDPSGDLATGWTAESLERHFAGSTDPLEGYWDYLDRSLEETSLRLGGRYRLALVKTPAGYDILYIAGAATDAHLWQPFMLKGKLTATRFTGSYDLVWYDTEKQPFTTDVHAGIDPVTLILTLHFPLASSQLRFAKWIPHTRH